MSFSSVLASLELIDGHGRATVAETWLQGRSVFGGLQAALAVRAMRSLLPTEAPLRAVQVTFVAPVPAGRLEVEARVLRTGKSVTHAEARLSVAGTPAAVVVGIFGAARPSRVAVVGAPPPVAPAAAWTATFVEGVTPSFLRHFGVRWLEGGVPFSGLALPRATLEVSMPGEATLQPEHILAIADMPPPLALSYLVERAPSSSLTWTVDFFEPAGRLADGAYRLDVELLHAQDGYTTQATTVWGPAGELVATSRQCMVIFG